MQSLLHRLMSHRLHPLHLAMNQSGVDNLVEMMQRSSLCLYVPELRGYDVV